MRVTLKKKKVISWALLVEHSSDCVGWGGCVFWVVDIIRNEVVCDILMM